MTTVVELERLARAAIPPVGMTDVCAVVDVEPCDRLTDDRSPSGLIVEPDGSRRAPRTWYGVAWVVDGRLKSKPIALLDRQADAFILIDLLRTGSSSRSARRSVAAVASAHRGDVGPAEGRAVQADVEASAADHPFPADARTAGDSGVAEAERDRSQKALPRERSGRSRPGLSPTQAGPTRRCKACGMSLEGRGPGQGQARQTCDDACRQAFRGGARAPEPGVVDEAFTARLSRLPKPAREAMDQDQQVAWGIDHP